MSDKRYSGMMGERIERSPSPKEAPTRARRPLESLRRPEPARVRTPGVPTEPAGAGTLALIALAAVLALIALGRLGGAPAPLPLAPPAYSEVRP